MEILDIMQNSLKLGFDKCYSMEIVNKALSKMKFVNDDFYDIYLFCGGHEKKKFISFSSINKCYFCDNSNVSSVIHELLLTMVYNKKNNCYGISNGTYEMNVLNNGLTEYLVRKILLNTNNISFYSSIGMIFEYLDNVLLCSGFDVLKRAYFSKKWNLIKDIFDEYLPDDYQNFITYTFLCYEFLIIDDKSSSNKYFKMVIDLLDDLYREITMFKEENDLIDMVTDDFADSLYKGNDELEGNFKKYILKKYGKRSYKCLLLKECEFINNMSLYEKKAFLNVDMKFEELKSLSYIIYGIAIDRLKGVHIIEDTYYMYLDCLKNILDGVESYNREIALFIYSECVLDLEYSFGEMDACSLRIGRYKRENREV